MAARRNWRMTAWVAGVFSVLVGLTMIYGRLSVRAEDPLKSPQLREYKEKLRLNPTDEQIKQRIRQLDLRLRQRYFRQLSQMESGVYLLLGGVAVFVLAVKQGGAMPKATPHAPAQAGRLRANRALRGQGALVGGGGRCGHRRLSLHPEPRPERRPAQADGGGRETAWCGRSGRRRASASH